MKMIKKAKVFLISPLPVFLILLLGMVGDGFNWHEDWSDLLILLTALISTIYVFNLIVGIPIMLILFKLKFTGWLAFLLTGILVYLSTVFFIWPPFRIHPLILNYYIYYYIGAIVLGILNALTARFMIRRDISESANQGSGKGIS